MSPSNDRLRYVIPVALAVMALVLLYALVAFVTTLRQARETMEAIHAAGLIHRDIKPENLMITRTGRVVVMDFGIAKGLGDGKSGLVAGTPAYMSPEQARGGELDAGADLFSAGVVLAEMVEPGGLGSFDARKKVW